MLCSVNHLVEQAHRKLYTAVVITCCLTHLESVLWLPVSHTTVIHAQLCIILATSKVETDISVVSSVAIVDHK